MINIIKRCVLVSTLVVIGFTCSVSANEREQVKKEFENILIMGENNFNDETLSTNGLACGQCHINAEKTRPESYPKFKTQLGKVVTIGQMINWCIANPLKGKALELDSKKMLSLISYITYQRRGAKLDPGK